MGAYHLLLCLALVSLVESKDVHFAPLFNTVNEEQRVPNEWLVLLHSDTDRSAHSTARDIQERHGNNLKVKDIYEMPGLKVIRIVTDDVTKQAIRSHDDVKLIEANLIFHLSSQDTCMTQDTGMDFAIII